MSPPEQIAERRGWLEGSFNGRQLVVIGADARRMRFEATRPSGGAA